MRRTILAIALAILWAASASAQKVVGGPYAVNVGPQSATVMWLVQAADGTLHAEKKPLTGLEPGKTNQYEAFSGDAGKGSFKTPPAGKPPFEFVVYGDTRTRHDVHRSVIAAILKTAHPDFVLHTGDLVADGRDRALWPIFFDIERDLLRNVAFYPMLGNHERDAMPYFEFLNAKSYYSFDWGGGHFAVIDSDIGNAGANQEQKNAFWQEQTRWLEEDLRAAQKADFRFVLAHHPPITAVSFRQGNNPEMTALEPMFKQYKVTAGFFGHDHNYQHYLKDGIHYFVSGGGGAPLYDVNDPPRGITQKVAKTENFLIVRVAGKTANVEVRTPDGKILDTAELKAQN